MLLDSREGQSPHPTTFPHFIPKMAILYMLSKKTSAKWDFLPKIIPR